MIPQAAAELPPDDAELARRIGQRDERAFEALMRRHNRMLYRLARSILKDEAEAEDAVQEAYLSAYRNIGSFRGGAKLSTWLARIVLNEAYGRLRKRKSASVVVSFDTYDRSEHQVEEGVMVDVTTEPPETAAMRFEYRFCKRIVPGGRRRIRPYVSRWHARADCSLRAPTQSVPGGRSGTPS
jgi:RNA polymerase sigma-70 factor (ECF subfamily)